MVSLVPGDALDEAFVIDVEAVTYAVAGLTVLILLSIYGFHNHLAILGGGSGDHGYWVLCYVVQALVRQLIKSLGHAEVGVLLDYAHEPIQIIERYQSIFVFLDVSQQEEVVLQQLLVVEDIKLFPI